MRTLLTENFFKFVSGFLAIVIVSLLVVAGIRTLSQNQHQVKTTTTTTTTQQ